MRASSTDQTPLIEFIKEHPSTDITRKVHSRTDRRPSFANPLATVDRSFRPCRSTRLRRFPPSRTSQVYCALQPIMGFAVFRVLPPGTRPNAMSAEHLLYSACPSELFPRQQLSPCHHGSMPSRCWSAFVVRRDRSPTETEHIPRPQGFVPLGEAAANAPPFPAECCPLLPWASRSVTPGFLFLFRPTLRLDEKNTRSISP